MSERTAHVWVLKPNIPTPWPGLVLEWRQGVEGWEALVTYIERMTVRPQIITEWVPADRLTPVPWRPGMGTAYG